MKAVISVLFVLFCLLLPSEGGSNDDKNVSTSTKSTCRGCTSCNNGLNGHNGLPGRDGRDGAKGEMGVAGLAGSRGAKGENGMTGPPGPRGWKGEKGMTGNPGARGVKGEMGPNGTDTDHRNWKQCAWKKADARDIGLIQNPNTCLQGSPGLPGLPRRNGHNGLPGRDSRDGAKGDKGMIGSTGSRGQIGDAGKNGADADHRNWKQCAWRSADGRDIGLIKDCVFDKRKDDTALRVVYQGNFYLGCNCCKRWFITFNGAECSGPLPIDVAWWMANGSQHSHKPGAIDGYCDNIHKGKIRVGINIGNCAGYGNSNGYTGWNSVSRLMIEEIPRSQ